MSNKAQWESLVSSAIKLAELDNDPDTRGHVRELIEQALESVPADETSWSKVKGKYLYDVYLQMREAENTATAIDYVRPGLNPGLFSSTQEWYAHCARVSEEQKNAGAEYEKTCSACGKTKHISKFKRNGGSKCGACQSKAYRERKMAAMS